MNLKQILKNNLIFFIFKSKMELNYYNLQKILEHNLKNKLFYNINFISLYKILKIG